MSSRHFLLDEGPSPSTETCQNRTAFRSIKPIISSQFHLPIRPINHNFFKKCQKPGVMNDDQLTLSDHIAKSAQVLQICFYSTSRRSGPFFRNMLHNSFFKLLFSPGWTIAMLSFLMSRKECTLHLCL